MLLVLIVLLNTYIFATFKLFARFNVDSLSAITVNYITCAITGYLVSSDKQLITSAPSQNWWLYALILGVLLISLFNLVSYSTRKEGMTVTTIASKISLVIPVLLSYLFYKDDMNLYKIIGVLVALPAVFFVSVRKGESVSFKHIYLPVIIFLGTGLFDSFLKAAQTYWAVTESEQAAFTTTGFAIAASIGISILVYRMVIANYKLRYQSIIGGVLLGVPNFFSVYLLVRLLDTSAMQSSVIIPVNNIGTVLAATITAVFIFKESMGKYRTIGMLLSVLSIILILASDII